MGDLSLSEVIKCCVLSICSKHESYKRNFLNALGVAFVRQYA